MIFLLCVLCAHSCIPLWLKDLPQRTTRERHKEQPRKKQRRHEKRSTQETPWLPFLNPNSSINSFQQPTTHLMTSTAASPNDYIATLPEDRVQAMTELRTIIKKNLPKGFEETMGAGMLNYVVPHSIYPDGYHCDP